MTMELRESEKAIDVYGEYDVVVIGGGPAGIAASVSAAKNGSKTLLVEHYGFLGGMGTAGGVTNFAGLYGRRNGEMVQLVHGVVDELLERLDRLGGLNKPQDGMQGRIRVRSYDTSSYKCAADQLLLHHGVDILFHAHAAAVLKDANRITHVIVETKSGRRAIRANAFIDCSGDGDLAAQAGVDFEVGDGHGSGLYPTTMFRVGNVDAEIALKAVGEFKAINDFMRLAQEKHPNKYQFPRDGAIIRPQINPTEWRVNVTQIKNAQGNAVNGVDALELSRGEIEGRRQVAAYFEFLRAEVPGFSNAYIIEIAPQIGIRETRRIKGVYQLTGADIEGSAQFEDSIGINAWPMELHTSGGVQWVFPTSSTRAYNDLPWRMLIPRQVDNLLVAGRCASATHEGQSASRASGGCFVMGQAAGTAASLFTGGTFTDLPVTSIQQRLINDGATIEK